MNEVQPTFAIVRYLTKNRFAFPVMMSAITVSTIATFVLIDYMLYGHLAMQLALDNAGKKINERNLFLKRFTQNANDILWSIRTSATFKRYLETPSECHFVNDLFLSFSQANPSMMQLRFIDSEGKERIRYDRVKSGEEPYRVTKLQDKKSRYYFEDSMEKPEKVWFSDLDLNIEYGKVELPYKPTYRAVLPVWHQEKFSGILIVNFFAKPMLDELFHAPLYDGILLDDAGYALAHYNQTKSWGYYQQPKVKVEEKYLKALNHEQYRSDEFVARRLDLPFPNRLTLILKLNDAYVMQQESRHNERLLKVSLIVLVLAFGVTWIMDRLIQNIARQITYQEKQVQELQERQREQEVLLIQQSRMADMGSMLSMIAHQWRQPIATLMGVLANMLDGLKSETVDRKALEQQIERSEDTLLFMSSTIDDFRSFFSRSKKAAEFDMAGAILGAYRLIGSQLEDHGIEMQLCLEPLGGKQRCIILTPHDEGPLKDEERFIAFGYPNEFKQVVLNLLSNAKDALLEHSANKKIQVLLEAGETQYKVSIRDNGTGISPEHLEKVFEPYFTTKDQLNGTGLGLYMSKMIVEKSFRGMITAQSEPENGTCIVIEIAKDFGQKEIL